MNTKKIKDIVLNSHLSDWSYNDERGIYTYKNDVNITIRRNDFDLEKEFQESWVEEYDDPKAYSVCFEIFYNGNFIEEKYFALVDGARMYIPYPKSPLDLIITEEDYKLGLLINLATNYDFNDYLGRAGILVDHNEFPKQNNTTINTEVTIDKKVDKEEKKTDNNLNTEVNFDFKDKIGEGCFATVWKAIENKLEREVAIKIFNPSAIFVSNEANLQNTVSKMLLDHAKLLAKVDHPNVVKIHYVTQVNHPNNGDLVDCIIMEYLDGVTLRERIETVLPIEEAKFIGNSIISGLESIHKKDITHNDFHTSNIIVSSETVKIIDPNSEQNLFILLSTLTKKHQFERDISFLKEILGVIISKIIELPLEFSYYFKENLSNEFDFIKIKEYFNEALAKKFETTTSTSILSSNNSVNEENNILAKVKEYISDDRYKIKLDDLVTSELKKITHKLDKDSFSLSDPYPNAETILERLKSYENLLPTLEILVIALSHWGESKHFFAFKKVFERLSDNIETESGKVYWLKLRCYPLLVLSYCSGISAILSENYQYLYSLFFCEMTNKIDNYITNKYLITLLDNNLYGNEIFKTLKGYERYYVPLSEYMFKIIQPILEDNLFLGKSYETLFDRFEIFFALVYADLNTNGSSGPIGRFVFKYKDRFHGVKENNLYNQIINEANMKKENWEPLKAGFFNGSYERFIEVSNNYKKFMESINWH